jgi:hypothetical protein
MSSASPSSSADHDAIVPAPRRRVVLISGQTLPAAAPPTHCPQHGDAALADQRRSQVDPEAAASAASRAATVAAMPMLDRTHKRTERDRARIDAEADPARRRLMEAQHRRECERVATFTAAVAAEVARSTALMSRMQRSPLQRPAGAFPALIRCHGSCAAIAGALGRLRCVPWEGDALIAIRMAAGILAAQTPLRGSVGAPPRRHVAHLVISAPHHHGTFPFCWDQELAVAVARHALRSQGCDPDGHDALMVIHSQRQDQGADHDEEAIHVLWSRIHHDGRCLTTPHAFVAAQLGRARWDARAGLDPMRVGIGRLRSHPVRQGYELLRQGRLAAHYRDLGSGEQAAILLQGAEFLAALGTEVPPPTLACSGLWTPKPCYRSLAEITRILAHLYQPERGGG